jgi:hypothetical protein
MGWTAPELTMDDLLHGNPIPTCSVLIRREHLRSRLPPRFQRCAMGDWPRWIFAASHGPWAVLPESMATYVIHGAGAWSQLALRDQLKRSIFMLSQIAGEIPQRHRFAAEHGLLQHYRLLATEAAQSDGEDLAWIAENIAGLGHRVAPPLWLEFQHQVIEALTPVIVRSRRELRTNEAIGAASRQVEQVCALRRLPARLARRVRVRASRTYQEIGNEHYTSGDYPAAARAYGRAIAADGRNARAWVYYGLCGLGRPGAVCRRRLQSMLAGMTGIRGRVAGGSAQHTPP